MTAVWSEEMDAALRAGLKDGLTYGQIAAAINETHGTTFSRCAAIGRGRRLGLCVPAASTSEPQRGATADESPAVFHDPPAEACGVVPGTWSLLDLRANQCRWPFGDAAPFAFCGCAVAAEGLAYCAEHHALGTRSAQSQAA